MFHQAPPRKKKKKTVSVYSHTDKLDLTNRRSNQNSQLVRIYCSFNKVIDVLSIFGHCSLEHTIIASLVGWRQQEKRRGKYLM